ncbi:MAG: Type IV pilus assembly protein PilM [Candidatus Woesebacteria bacterium GW2011_GWA2_40_7b]|uniref:Type IV pilus assembly protein PilM n=1 Tax=Candidatus Woesebacteria bacterium GW2011_GWA2_40_7b TaxID=1618563 RepID=A0A0G0T4P9_9BACT|nr:MAG: Type IV pilus assembly protein PilM [Candidatus Woesebacteria bacterium GW2011_GWA2_40_7b]
MVGLDIGSKTIKIVDLAKDGAGFSLSATGIVGYTGNSIVKIEDEKEMTSLSQVIRKLHKEAGVSSHDVVLSISEPQVFTRTIKFPLLMDSEIASAVKWEAEQYIPIPVSEAVVQHTIIARNETSTPPGVVVLLVAAPRVIIEKYTKAVSLAGLNPVAIETELLALSRALSPLDKTVLLVDFGGTSTNIAITKNGTLSFSRSIPTAGEAFSRSVSQGLGVTAPQAEEYKKTYGLETTKLEGKVKGALDPVLRLVADEIKKAVNYYQTEEGGEVPSMVTITGGTSSMPKIVPTLSELLGMEVSVGNPFSKVKADPEILKKLASYAPLYAVSVGLAMREE